MKSIQILAASLLAILVGCGVQIVVVDTHGTVLPGVAITPQNQPTTKPVVYTTDETGQARITGNYMIGASNAMTIDVTKEGYEKQSVDVVKGASEKIVVLHGVGK